MTRSRRPKPSTVLLIVGALTVAVCAQIASRPGLTREQAYLGVEKRIHATAAELFPHARLEVFQQMDAPCELWGRSKKYRLEHNFVVPHRSTADNALLIADARDLWHAQGYRITREFTDRHHRWRDVAAVDADGYSIRLWQNSHGDLYLDAASPCLPHDRSGQPPAGLRADPGTQPG